MLTAVASPCLRQNWVKWENLGIFCYFLLGAVEKCDGFKKYEKKCKFLQSETLRSYSILFSEQVEIMATGT